MHLNSQHPDNVQFDTSLFLKRVIRNIYPLAAYSLPFDIYLLFSRQVLAEAQEAVAKRQEAQEKRRIELKELR